MLSVALLLALVQETAPPEPAAPEAPPEAAPAPVPSAPAPGEPPPIAPREDSDDCDDDERTVAPPCPANDDGEDSEDSEDDDDGDDEDSEDDDDDDGIEVGPAEQPLDDDDDDATLASESRLTFGGRLGAAAGNVLAVPFFVPGPGAFVTGTQRLVAFDLLFAGAEAGLSLGLDENSTTAVAGYKGRALAGLRLSFDWITFEGDMHGGITSIALVPAPRFGLGLETRVALPVCCAHQRIVTLDAEGRFDADLLVIAPAPALSVEGGATWYIGPVFLRGRAGIDADAVVAILANAVSASVFAAITLGLNVDVLD